MTKLIATVLLFCALCGCVETPTKAKCAGDECRNVLPARAPTQVPGIKVGMTISEVVDVLGEDYRVYPNQIPPVEPSSYSYPYTENGKKKYRIVNFWNGKVSSAFSGYDHPDGFFFD